MSSLSRAYSSEDLIRPRELCMECVDKGIFVIVFTCSAVNNVVTIATNQLSPLKYHKTCCNTFNASLELAIVSYLHTVHFIAH